MAERLTEHKTTKGITRIVIKPYVEMSEEFQPVADKLCAFEDILEKYGIESLDTLKHIIKKGILINTIDFAKEAYDEMEQDRDTWKRACELACRHIAEVEWLSCPETDDISESENEIKTLTKQSLNYFCQQAKQVTGKLPAN